MWCTTQCWECEDRKCEHYISKTELYFENQKKDKEIESQKRVINGMIDNEEQYCLEINRLNNIIDNAIEETKLGIQILQETKENYPNINCDVVINKYLKPIYKALKDSDKND